MPQTMPMNWLMMFLMFSISLFLINTLNFFTFSNSFYSKHLMKSLKKNKSWKW
nr:ATP synthase F0 subunit 8 [Carrikerella sp.]